MKQYKNRKNNNFNKKKILDRESKIAAVESIAKIIYICKITEISYKNDKLNVVFDRDSD